MPEKILIGLEIHVTPKTFKKVFNPLPTFSDNDYCSELSSIGSWELGYLGVLPILNKEIIDCAIKLCSALKSDVSRKVIFDRKIYSYFDLPKGFQITQERFPIGNGGFLEIFDGKSFKKIKIKNVQIEEDTAKSSYEGNKTYLDFRRSGNPLIEIVTEPVFDNIEDVLSFLKQLRIFLKYLEISEAKMENGQFRVDLNFSFNFFKDYKTPRYEIKNLNSFKNIKRAFNYELHKHGEMFESGSSKKKLKSQTLGYNESTHETFIQRDKKTYFYVPEHNIIPIFISDYYLEKTSIKKNLPIEILKGLPLKILNSEKVNSLIENLVLLNFFDSLLRNNIDFSKYALEVLNFSLNYLSPLYSLDRNLFIEKNVFQIWDLFCYLNKGLLDREKLKEILQKLLIRKEKILSEDIKLEIEKNSKKNFVDPSEIEKEIRYIVSDKKNEKKIKKNLPDKLRLFGFIFGKIKEKFPGREVDFKASKDLFLNIWETIFKD